jgi:predicted short-subunit dehydrogenase-like oxidoreductase (DUF2520 family)
MTRPTLGFIGIGVVGTALATALHDVGYPIAAVCSRRPDQAVRLATSLPSAHAVERPQDVVDRCDVVFLTVSDDAIRPVCESLSWNAQTSVVHCNGASSIDLLAHAAAGGSATGVLHPLQSFPTPEQAAANIPGSPFGIEASDERFLETLRRIASDLGGTAFVVRGDKAIYHASAVIASNYLVTLLDLAAGLWEKLGLTKDEGLHALLPLVHGTVENLERVGLPDALTGPIARGDVGTIGHHLDVLARVAPDVVPVYKELARRTIPIAMEKKTIDRAAGGRLLDRLERG